LLRDSGYEDYLAPVRAAFLIDRFRPGKGGLEVWLESMGRALLHRGHEPHLVSGDRSLVSDIFTTHTLPPRGLRRATRDSAFARSARDFCAQADFDVVVGLRHCLRCDVYYPHGGTVPATFAARHRYRPFLPARVRNFLRLERELLTGAEPPARIAAVSEMVRRDLVREYPGIADRVRVVPNGVDLSRFCPEGRNRDREKLVPGGGATVAFLARNPALKGWRVAREVFARLRSDGVAGGMLVAGGRPRGLPGGARYLGPTRTPEEVLRAADLLLYPTLYDPFPLVVLEALACGTPVATTERNGALDHVVRDGPVAAVEDPEDVGGITRAAAGLLRDAPRAEARRRAEGFPLGESIDRSCRLLLEASR
jgi:UDP-glucose:(heptosyl)LPS alpha-1,3-glucosyltransferase